MAVIYITEADNTQHKYRLPADSETVVSIGRNDDCLISLPSIVGISGLHCTITLVDGAYVITDNASTNGTLEGERRISSEPLRAGVVYGIGNATMTFDPELPEAAPAAQPSTPAPTERKSKAAPSALAEAAAAIGVGKRKPAPAALAEAAAAIGVKGAGAPATPAAEAAPAEEKPKERREPEARIDSEPAAKPDAKPAAKAEGKEATASSSSGSKPEKSSGPKLVTDPAAAPLLVPAPAKKKNPLLSVVNLVYVLAVIALAFYAGLTLRHWAETGSYLPSAKKTAAKPAAKTATPTVAPSSPTAPAVLPAPDAAPSPQASGASSPASDSGVVQTALGAAVGGGAPSADEGATDEEEEDTMEESEEFEEDVEDSAAGDE